jgi:endo-alpha-1,4-polygalactosaminidase (GH114 family)
MKKMAAFIATAVLTVSCTGPSGGPAGSGGGGGNSGNLKTWSIQYEGPIVARGKDYHIVDMYDVSSTDIAKLKSQGTKPIAYFSSQYENWRKDASQFSKSDIGKSLDGWKGENWINPRSAAVRAIMLKRLDYAKSRGFYGVDVDNVDFYEFSNGFGSGASDAVDYVKFLARAAHARGLKFGLKNAVDIIPATRGVIDYYVNEQAHQYDDLDAYRGVSKPVFNIEYRRPSKGTRGMYTIYKSGAVMDAREEVVLP